MNSSYRSSGYYLTILLVCITSNILSASDSYPGFVITNENDTVYGLINLKDNISNCKKCEFKTSKQAKVIHYLPDSIRTYRFINGRYYVSREIQIDSTTRKKVFLQYLVDGIADLYAYTDPKGTFYYIEKDGSGLIKLDYKATQFTNKYGDIKIRYNENYKGQLTYLFRDNAKIFPDINNTSFDHNSLIGITKEYQKMMCPDQKCTIFEKRNKSEVFIGPQLGYQYSWLTLEGTNNIIKNYSPVMGFTMRFVPMEIFYRWNLILGVYASPCHYDGFISQWRYQSYARYWLINYDYTTLRFPVILRYSIPIRPFFINLDGGLNSLLMLGNNYSLIETSSDGNIFGKNNFEFQRCDLGYTIGAGLLYELSGKIDLHLKTEYYTGYPDTNIRSLKKLRTHAFEINLGIDYAVN